MVEDMPWNSPGDLALCGAGRWRERGWGWGWWCASRWRAAAQATPQTAGVLLGHSPGWLCCGPRTARCLWAQPVTCAASDCNRATEVGLIVSFGLRATSVIFSTQTSNCGGWWGLKSARAEDTPVNSPGASRSLAGGRCEGGRSAGLDVRLLQAEIEARCCRGRQCSGRCRHIPVR